MPSEATGSSGEIVLRELFLEDSVTRIDALDDGAARLSADAPDPALVEALWREAHTLKGGASLAGLAVLVELAAEIEAILSAVRDGRLAVSDVLLDDLRDAVGELREERARVADGPGPIAPDSAVDAPAVDVTVLVVDDDQLVRELLRRILEGAGYAVVTVDASSAALDVLATRSIDLVVTDLEMPGGDGVALVQAIKGDPSTMDVPVVVLSALREDDDGADLVASGADAVLSKGAIDRAGLVALVDRHVRGRSG